MSGTGKDRFLLWVGKLEPEKPLINLAGLQQFFVTIYGQNCAWMHHNGIVTFSVSLPPQH